ncbi:MAG: hypothetical protein PUG44_02410 [Streptococcus hyointestinalis]|nr:hypothetical protein [Streptococcus hyointestinalis]MDD7355897.1 hypothetical protein [Streptococcus hyointestinalis]
MGGFLIVILLWAIIYSPIVISMFKESLEELENSRENDKER